ncbi:MAG TPA: tetratricopeptide repeat protein [Anaerolineales bacterium]|nr:tetratricopeptide repeat protein [Anaerolineales bacterium]HNF93438.1 tetratricopeptide repeat protein [Anaerolineales bacterium]HNM35462.1 tetratricopeptide repeat protein [Anaerolineales bacterium]
MPGREDIFQKAMNEGHSAAWDQEWSKAVAAYRRALEESPDNPKALSSLGQALHQLNNVEEALQIYMRAVKVSPDDPVSMEKVAQLSERVGDLKTATEAAIRAGDLFLKQRDTDKALENWVHVTSINPEHAIAHSRLAQVHERLGHGQQAAMEYLAIASILQRAGNPEKTQEMVNKAQSLVPNSAEVKQAQTLLRTGQLLPKPIRAKGGTGPIRMAQVKQLQEPAKKAASGLDPIAEARQKALTQLAEVLFDLSDDSSPVAQDRKGISAIMRGTGSLSAQSEQLKVVLHLGQAIDAQSKGNDTLAAEEMEAALNAGFSSSALSFSIGYLRFKNERYESAQRALQNSVKHEDYGLASRLLLGDIISRKGDFRDAATQYLEALKFADAATVPLEQGDDIRQQYEPLIESYQQQTDEAVLRKVCDNIRGLLMRADWRDQLHKTRDQMPKQDGMAAPLADMILQVQSSSVLESMNRINQLARMGSLRSAMDEAYDAIQHAPTYLPLHIIMGDLLVQEGHTTDAIAKFSVVAHSYSVRGEVMQASKLLRRIIQISPMDLGARNRLIDQLVARGQVDDAIQEYLELAAIYYRLAELDMARKTYTHALRIVQQGNASRDWNTHILQRMADIDMQRLDWKQALRVYEQIRTLMPDDDASRKQLIELNMRMGQQDRAMSELESYITHLESQNKQELAIAFLEELARDHEDQPLIKRTLAALLHRSGRIGEAIPILDQLGEALLEKGDKQGAMEVINQIVLMNPPNVQDYRVLLSQMQNS